MDSLDEMDIYGYPLVSPRIGDEYQAKLPLVLKTEALPSKLIQKQGLNAGVGANEIDYNIRLRLPIPVVWIPNKIHHVNDKKKEFSDSMFAADSAGQTDMINSSSSKLNGHMSLKSKNSCTGLKMCKVETPDETSDPEKQKNGSLSAQVEAKISGFQKRKVRGCTALPGLQNISWTDAEIESFLLGLYIFGKNFVNMLKVVECKKMGDILSFYYGKFYRSNAHHKWSECKKLKSRRCVLGQRIFSGWRQQELLSRLLPNISDQNQENLKEVAMSFSEGRISLEEYVFALKTTVGLAALVQAIGIGKGKHDLTRVALDPFKANQILTFRSEIPKGKTLSSLTSGGIITYLTGNFRLSKTRSNDLFWEAVWPRLLARGWHSEQPKNQDYVTSKNSLVFLVPRVKKFSRKKLVKGKDYFDSVSDVLDKVASEPMLLELEMEMANENVVGGENGWTTDAKLHQIDSSYHGGHSYLHPSLPSCTSDFMKFTVVDTSLVQGEAPPKIRELRSLPMNNSWSCVSSSPLNENDSNNKNEQQDSGNVSLNHQEMLDPDIPSDSKLGKDMECLSEEMQSVQFLHEFTAPKKKATNGLDSDVRHNNPFNEQPIKDRKCDRRRVKSGNVSLNHQEMLDPDIPSNNKLGNDMKCLSEEIQSVQFLHEFTAPKKKAINRLDSDIRHNNPFNEQPIKDIKCQKRRVKSGKPMYLSPVSKRRRFTACQHSQSGHYNYSFSKKHHPEEKASCQLKAPSEVPKKGLDQPQCKYSSSGIAIRNNGKEIVVGNSCSVTKPVTKKAVSEDSSQHKVLIDLNLPHFPPDFDPAEPCSVEMVDSLCDLSVDHALSVGTEKQNDESQVPGSFDAMHVEQQHTENARRQGTRNRPPTAKALEAVALGYLIPRQRGSSSRATLAAMSKPSRRARKIVKSSATTRNHSIIIPDIVDSSIDLIDEECRSYTSETVLFSKSLLDQGSNGFFYDSLGMSQTSYPRQTSTQ